MSPSERRETTGERMERLTRALAEPIATSKPDGAFASRVLARLPANAAPDVLGWAALRLLPIAGALVIALAWFTYAEPTVEDGGDDIAEWVLTQYGETP